MRGAPWCWLLPWPAAGQAGGEVPLPLPLPLRRRHHHKLGLPALLHGWLVADHPADAELSAAGWGWFT
jgi:hypothetical protein